MVKFIVGEGDRAEEFVVHKAFACYHSPVFDAAFNSPFLEGQTQTYRLEDVLPQLFKYVVQWMYAEALVIPSLRKASQHPPKVPDEGSNKGTHAGDFPDDDFNEIADPTFDDNGIEIDEFFPEAPYLFRMWILADRLDIPKLQNHIVNRLTQGAELLWSVPSYSCGYIYEHTSRGNPLRKWIVDQCVCGFSNYSVIREQKLYPREMLLDMYMHLNAHATRLTTGDEQPSSAFHVPVPHDTSVEKDDETSST